MGWPLIIDHAIPIFFGQVRYTFFQFFQTSGQECDLLGLICYNLVESHYRLFCIG